MAQYVTWLQLGLIFGPHAPLILPLLVVCFLMSRWTHEQGLRRFGMAESQAEDARDYRPIKHVVFAVICQQGLMLSLFYSSNLAGKEIVAVGTALVAVACAAIIVVPASMLEVAVLGLAKRICCYSKWSGSLVSAAERRLPWLWEQDGADLDAASPGTALRAAGGNDHVAAGEDGRLEGVTTGVTTGITIEMTENPVLAAGGSNTRRARLEKLNKQAVDQPEPSQWVAGQE